MKLRVTVVLFGCLFLTSRLNATTLFSDAIEETSSGSFDIQIAARMGHDFRGLRAAFMAPTGLSSIRLNTNIEPTDTGAPSASHGVARVCPVEGTGAALQAKTGYQVDHFFYYDPTCVALSNTKTVDPGPLPAKLLARSDRGSI